MNKHETQKAAPESLQLKCGFCIFQKIPGTRVSAIGTPFGLLERAKRLWNAPWNGSPLKGSQRGLGTTWNAPGLLEQSRRLYLERAPAHLEPSGTREALLEQSRRLYLERALAQMEPSDTA